MRLPLLMSILAIIAVYFSTKLLLFSKISNNEAMIFLPIISLLAILYVINCFVIGGTKSKNGSLSTVSGVLFFFAGPSLSPLLSFIHACTTKNTINQAQLKQTSLDDSSLEKVQYTKDTPDSISSQVEYENTSTDPKASKHLSKSDFKNIGIRLHLVPLSKRIMKYLKRGLDRESSSFIAETTFPFFSKALIKSILYSIFASACIICMMIGVGDPEDMIIFIGGYVVFAFLLWRQERIVAGYLEFADSSLISLLALFFYLLTIVFQMAFLLMSQAFGGNGEKFDHLSNPRVGIPQGFGLDDLIIEGEAADLYHKLSNTIDRQLVKNEYNHYEKQYKDASEKIDDIDNAYNYQTSDVQEALRKERLKQENELNDASYNMNHL